MKMTKSTHGLLLLIAILGISFIVGCSLSAADPTPAVTTTVPSSADTSVAINGPITATFNKAMDPATIEASTFTVTAGTVPVTGTVTYDAANKTAIFTPTDNLDHLTTYTATVTTGVTDLPGKFLGADRAAKTPAADKVWKFKTAGIGPAPVRNRQIITERIT